MTFTISMITPMCLLVAIFMLATVIGRDIDKRQRASTPPPGTLCGRRLVRIVKRSDEHTGSNDMDKSDDLDKIVRGFPTVHGEFPWIVNILANGSPKCAGAILSKYWILTVADCVHPRHGCRYLMVVGDKSFSRNDTGQQTLDYSQIIFHGLYNDSMKNNIALIKVSGSGIQFNNYVQPICLPKEGETKLPGTWMKMAGWGYQTAENSTHPGELRTRIVDVMNQTHCAGFSPPGGITSNELCVRPWHGLGDACPGDYGGPVSFHKGAVNILGGVISHSISGCQVPSDGVVLANVLSHKPWIEATISHYSNDTEGVIPRRTA